MRKLVTSYIKSKMEKIADLHTWDFKVSIPEERLNITIGGTSWLEKTLSLKEQLRTYLNKNTDADSHEKVAKYFITEWGGIKRFSRSKEVVSDFSHWRKTSERPEPSSFKPKFTSVSSWSKWASLVCPDWACIYDSRVAYSINAINYLGGGEHKIFPSPDGRNSRIGLLDVSTLLLAMKLKQDDSSNPKNVKAAYFVKEKDAYFEYLKLVGLVSEALWNDSARIHEVEMLLFALADKDVYEDLFTNVSLKASAVS